MKSYTELLQFQTFEERFNYLKLDGTVGVETFGFDRWLNQQFYRSKEWKQVRNEVILRDGGCDLGIEDHPIGGRIIIHHMNPITQLDIIKSTEILLNPEFLISTMKRTHDAIHYGDASLLTFTSIERSANDTAPWR